MGKGTKRTGPGTSASALRRSARSARTAVGSAVGVLKRAMKRIDEQCLDEEEAKKLERLAGQVVRSLQTALDHQLRLEGAVPEESDGALDVEAALAEVRSRLARLAG